MSAINLENQYSFMFHLLLSSVVMAHTSTQTSNCIFKHLTNKCWTTITTTFELQFLTIILISISQEFNELNENKIYWHLLSLLSLWFLISIAMDPGLVTLKDVTIHVILCASSKSTLLFKTQLHNFIINKGRVYEGLEGKASFFIIFF